MYLITEETLSINGYHGRLHQQISGRNVFLCRESPKDYFKTKSKNGLFPYITKRPPYLITEETLSIKGYYGRLHQQI